MIELNKFYSGALRRITKKTFPFWQRLGVHVTPRHFYEPIPDTERLRDDHLWSKHSKLVGIEIDEETQLQFLSLFVSKFKKECDSFLKENTSVPCNYHVNNGLFEGVDGEVLYCMIRHFKPRRVFEIGSGNSTYLSAQAIQKNTEEDYSHQCELVAIEPYPNDVLKTGFPGLSKLIAKRAQDVPLSEFRKLTANDILFIDSSHVLKTGSDVQYEYLEILPRLNQGVIVHAHDIFLPAEYPRRWVLKDYTFFNEQYLLQAFLAFNTNFEVLWAAHYMHQKYASKLEEAFSSYKKDGLGPSSFWMRKVK